MPDTIKIIVVKIPHQSLGFQYNMASSGQLLVTDIDPTSLVADTRLGTGMEILSVNGIGLEGKPFEESVRILEGARGCICITVRDPPVVTTTVRDPKTLAVNTTVPVAGNPAGPSAVPRNNPSNLNNSDLLDQAHDAAHDMAFQWIRSTFREICYQLWKDHWNVEHVVDPAQQQTPQDNDRNTTTTTHCRLHLTADMVQQAQSTCQRVADRWCERLQALGHMEVSHWIQQVVREEGPTLFFVEDDDREEDVASGNIGHETGKRKRSSVTKGTTVRSRGRQQQDGGVQGEEKTEERATSDGEEGSEHGIENTTTSNGITFPTKTCAMAAIRQLRRPNIPGNQDDGTTQHHKDYPNDEQYVLDQLNAMGMAGKTHWPFDWDIVKNAALQIPQRLHFKQTSEYKKNFQLELVPKSELENMNDNHDTTNANDADSDAETLLVANVDRTSAISVDHPDMPPPPAAQPTSSAALAAERMLLAYQRSRQAATRSSDGRDAPWKKQKLDELEFVNDVPRPPAINVDSFDIHWAADNVSEDIGCPELDACLHPETPSMVPHTLLGALKTAGHIHHTMQMPEDFKERDIKDMGDRQHKRKFQTSFRERLGPHQIEKDPKEHNVRTKVKRTLALKANKNDTVTTNSPVERWWDLDLGECVLDLETGEEAEADGNGVRLRRLYAFSTLEITLLENE